MHPSITLLHSLVDPLTLGTLTLLTFMEKVDDCLLKRRRNFFGVMRVSGPPAVCSLDRKGGGGGGGGGERENETEPSNRHDKTIELPTFTHITHITHITYTTKTTIHETAGTTCHRVSADSAVTLARHMACNDRKTQW